MSSLEKRIAERSARVAVVGLGYVGLPLAERALEAGYDVLGIDKYLSDGRRLEIAEKGIGISETLEPVCQCDVVLICVPTPLGPDRQPDISFVAEAAEEIAGNFGSGAKLIVLESTSYPGTTREVVVPAFARVGLELGDDLCVAYAPERVDPGEGRMAYRDIPRVVGGLDERSGRLACSFYENLVSSVVLVSTPEVAEMSKLLENIFRAVNIALVNEMSVLSSRMGIDIWEVVEAASTKPFGFMKFEPGPGVGGHCIPVDPFYLAWKVKQFDFYPEFIELAGKINRAMPFRVVETIIEALNSQGKSAKGARVLIIGVAYKPDVADIRESPALKVIELLEGHQAVVLYHDPLVGSVEVGARRLSSLELTPETVGGSDCVVILTAHSGLDVEMIGRSGVPVVDTRNALGKAGCPSSDGS